MKSHTGEAVLRKRMREGEKWHPLIAHRQNCSLDSTTFRFKIQMFEADHTYLDSGYARTERL